MLMLGRAEEMILQGERHLQSSGRSLKKDLSKVKCFACHKLGHYASQCPQWKKGRGKQQASSIEVDEATNMFQREFLLVSSLSGTVSNSGT
jgi:hypothetical protein